MLKNIQLATSILEMIETAIEAVGIMYSNIEGERLNDAEFISVSLHELLVSIHKCSPGIKEEEQNLNLPEASESCIGALKRIMVLLRGNHKSKALEKILFELEPLLLEMKCNFYFWSMIYGDEEKTRVYYEEELAKLYTNPFIEASERMGSYKYELSIAVRGYNKLDYTKMCVESLLNNLPEDLSYELIMVNHGSTDETKKFFESIRPHKQIDIDVNGGGLGAVARIVEGKYFIQISNDIIITKNSIQNLYNCISSDEQIGWVVPSTSNVSNLQSIAAKYKTREELDSFVERNNISNPNRWEQRTRLVNPVDVLRMKDFIETGFFGYFYDQSNRFPDDRLSLLFRRAGKKLYLAKDAYCHHFGSVTHNGQEADMEKIYMNGRVAFRKFFGVDPWGKGFCYDPVLFSSDIPIKSKKDIHILGINCGMGSNPLKVKELIKEKNGITEVSVENFSNEPEYVDDSFGVSDKVTLFDNWNQLNLKSNNADYIVIEEVPDNNGIFQDFLEQLKIGMNKEAVIILKLTRSGLLEVAKDKLAMGFELREASGHGNDSWVVFS